MVAAALSSLLCLDAYYCAWWGVGGLIVVRCISFIYTPAMLLAAMAILADLWRGAPDNTNQRCV